MIKQFSCLVLLCLAVSLNAMKPSAVDTGATAPTAARFADLTSAQQQRLWDLNTDIQAYFDSFDYEGASTFAAVEARLNERVFVEVAAPLDVEFISLIEKIQRRIVENNERIAQLKGAGMAPSSKLVRDAARLKAVKELLDTHLRAHGVVIVDNSQPNKDERVDRRRGPHSSGSGKGGFFSGNKKYYVCGTVVFLGLGYAVWRKFLTTSDEDKK